MTLTAGGAICLIKLAVLVGRREGMDYAARIVLALAEGKVQRLEDATGVDLMHRSRDLCFAGVVLLVAPEDLLEASAEDRAVALVALNAEIERTLRLTALGEALDRLADAAFLDAIGPAEPPEADDEAPAAPRLH